MPEIPKHRQIDLRGLKLLQQEIAKAVEQNRDRITRLLQNLVRIESENHPPVGNEGRVQAFIAQLWEKNGVECESFIPTDVPSFTSHPAFFDAGRSYEDRPVVVAKIPGTGGGRSLIFAGHVDVVPAAGEWKHEPYAGYIEDGKLYGRGAFDMKGGVAAMIMAALLLKEMGVKLKGDVIVETTPDEEFASSNGCVAARARGYLADAAIVTEPSGMNVVIAQRGFRLVRITITGRTGIPVVGGEMVNPVQHLPAVLKGIEDFRAKRLLVSPEDTVMIVKLAANEFRDDELLTVPPDCRMEVYWQVMPGEEHADVDVLFEKSIRDACSSDPFFSENPIRFDYYLRPMPGSSVPLDAPIAKEAAEAVQKVTGGPAGILEMFPPNDMFVFNKYCGIPAIVVGPGGDGAHAPDEYVLIDDVVRCVEIYMNLIVNWCGVAN